VSRVWLITGAYRGLGRAFTEEALKAGHRVVATARNSEQLVELASKFGQSVRIVSVDVTKETQANCAVDTAIQAFGGLDVLVNNAGYGNVSPVEDTPLADFRATAPEAGSDCTNNQSTTSMQYKIGVLRVLRYILLHRRANNIDFEVVLSGPMKRRRCQRGRETQVTQFFRNLGMG
jgi:NAD(P)-dependent dehydrogenase (short-subunit alcohol dehydrogenase family)